VQHLKEILWNFQNKNIKESMKIKTIYQEVVNKNIVAVTSDIVYKNRTLTIYVKDTAWAAQLMQYKHKILKRIKGIVKDIKEVKIKVSFEGQEENESEQEQIKSRRIKKDMTGLINEINNCDDKYRDKVKSIILKSAKEYEHVCGACGSPILSKKSNFCALCIHRNKASKVDKVKEILEHTPWLRYEDIEPEQRNSFDYTAYMQEKKFKINRIRDIITNEYFDIKKNEKSNLEVFKTKIEELVILKLSIEPSGLTEQSIENNIPKKWLKVYKS